MVDPAVSGISAGDSRELALDAAFPAIAEMEHEHGGLIKAMFARRRQPMAKILSFDGGGPPHPVKYEDTEHYRVTRDFLNAPESFLRHLLRDEERPRG